MTSKHTASPPPTGNPRRIAAPDAACVDRLTEPGDLTTAGAIRSLYIRSGWRRRATRISGRSRSGSRTPFRPGSSRRSCSPAASRAAWPTRCQTSRCSWSPASRRNWRLLRARSRGGPGRARHLGRTGRADAARLRLPRAGAPRADLVAARLRRGADRAGGAPMGRLHAGGPAGAYPARGPARTHRVAPRRRHPDPHDRFRAQSRPVADDKAPGRTRRAAADQARPARREDRDGAGPVRSAARAARHDRAAARRRAARAERSQRRPRTHLLAEGVSILRSGKPRD